MKFPKIVLVFIFFIVLFILTKERYVSYLPTLSVYPDNIIESKEVQEYANTPVNRSLFYETDESVTNAFVKIVPMTKSQLEDIITQPWIICLLYGLKFSINRARPYQVNDNIQPLKTSTGHTPAYPAGHAFQAYLLAKILSEQYPEKKEKLYTLAGKCDICRIEAGIHYKSDGEFSRKLVDFFIQ
jgi:hypothetical protein